MKRFMALIKGFIIGSSMAVPGVSGGTMAIVLGIYDRLLSAINGLRKNFKENVLFLLKFGIGAGVGLVLFYELIGTLLDYFPIPVSCLFFGAVIGGLPTLFKTIKPPRLTAGFCAASTAWGILGAAIIFGITCLPKSSFSSFSSEWTLVNVLTWIFVGFVIALALVLPGISTSHMLLVVLGIESLTEIPLDALAIMGISAVISIFIITRPLEWAMKRFTMPTYSVIIGFVLGSLWQIFSEKVLPDLAIAREWWQWVIYAAVSAVTFVGGLLGLLYLSRYSED